MPSCSLSSLWKIRPPMSTWLGHCTVLDGRRPRRGQRRRGHDLERRARAGTRPAAPGRSRRDARPRPAPRPVDGWIATRSTGFDVAADRTAREAASWTLMSMLVCTGWPGDGGEPGGGRVGARALDLDGQRRPPGQPGLVGLLDPAQADQVARLVGGTQRPGLRGGRGDHVPGEQLQGAGLEDRLVRAQHGAVGREHRGPGRPGRAEHEPVARAQPGVDVGRAPAHPPVPAALDQRAAGRGRSRHGRWPGRRWR